MTPIDPTTKSWRARGLAAEDRAALGGEDLGELPLRGGLCSKRLGLNGVDHDQTRGDGQDREDDEHDRPSRADGEPVRAIPARTVGAARGGAARSRGLRTLARGGGLPHARAQTGAKCPRSGAVRIEQGTHHDLPIIAVTVRSAADLAPARRRRSSASVAGRWAQPAPAQAAHQPGRRPGRRIGRRPAQLAAAWNDPKRVLLATILCSVAMYGAVLSAMLHPDSMPTSVKVFGERPLGMPLRLFVALFFTLLSVPIPVGAWHSYRILFRAASEGRGFSKQEIIMSLLRTPSSHPDLRRSRRIVLGVGTFYLALMFGWIAYAAARGI